MASKTAFIACFLFCLFASGPLFANEKETAEEGGTIFTFWPLIDYRESPADGYRNLALLGPLVKFQQWGDESDIAVRPLVYRSANAANDTVATDYLYPVVSAESTPEMTTVQGLQLFQKNVYRKGEGENEERSSMLFPFYISGTSKKYGPYTSVFPFYGDIYERFWRDEYHYAMFPLYARTVKQGTTTRNYLYPVFSTVEGEKESGFQVWPLYGEAAKEGSYRKRFVLWPFFMQEKSGLGGDNPTDKLFVLPFYASIDSPKSTARYYPWPFVGHKTEVDGGQEEWDYFWPFWRTVQGERRNLTSWLPFYAEEKAKERSKRWIMWPLYKHEEISSDIFRQERDRLLYFLYSDNRESWPKDGAQRRRTALWPLFLYKRDPQGVMSLSFPALIESVLDRDGIEKNWAPLWRIYQVKWDDSGNSAASFLWNFYWHDVRKDALSYELFPLIAYRSAQTFTDLQLLKGFVRYRNRGGEKSLSFLWLPFGVNWGEAVTTAMTTGGAP